MQSIPLSNTWSPRITASVIASFVPESTVSIITEIHYDNYERDEGEFVEIAGPGRTGLNGYQRVFYIGNVGSPYLNRTLRCTVHASKSGFGFFFLAFRGDAIKNGTAGIVLVDSSGSILEFISYRGGFTATSGLADGMMSVDIGIVENPTTPFGYSIQKVGSACTSDSFFWYGYPTFVTPGDVNGSYLTYW